MRLRSDLAVGIGIIGMALMSILSQVGCCGGSKHTIGASFKTPGGLNLGVSWTIDPDKTPDPPPDPFPETEEKD